MPPPTSMEQGLGVSGGWPSGGDGSPVVELSIFPRSESALGKGAAGTHGFAQWDPGVTVQRAACGSRRIQPRTVKTLTCAPEIFAAHGGSQCPMPWPCAMSASGGGGAAARTCRAVCRLGLP